MTKRIFPNFPSPSVVKDIELQAVFERHGGIAVILDPNVDLPSELFVELEASGYSGKELSAWRLLKGSVGREGLVLTLACLGCQIARNPYEPARLFNEAVFKGLSAERKAFNITYEEIATASGYFSPYISYESCSSGP